MKETIRKRLEEKGHTDPDKGLESFGVKVEQKGHPRFSNEGFMWYGNMITDPTKDETATYTVDPRVYYAGHYEQWLTWKARRKEPQNVTQETPTVLYDPRISQATDLISASMHDWINGPMSEGISDDEIDDAWDLLLDQIARNIKKW